MTDQQQKPTLYERLGGYDAVLRFRRRGVEDLYEASRYRPYLGARIPNRRSRKSISTLSIFCASTGAATRSTGDETW